MVYFIENTATGDVKIGYSADPLARLRKLQTGNSSSLTMLGWIEGDKQCEAELHARFAESRVGAGREWFDGTVIRAHLPMLLGLSESARPDDPIELVLWWSLGDLGRITDFLGRGRLDPADARTAMAYEIGRRLYVAGDLELIAEALFRFESSLFDEGIRRERVARIARNLDDLWAGIGGAAAFHPTSRTELPHGA